jgi:hypothetical protein
MIVMLNKILSGRGDYLIENSDIHLLYKRYASGERGIARDLMIRLNIDYFNQGGSAHTDEEVRNVYAEKGLDVPERHEDADPAIVWEAVARRVDEYFARFESLIQFGYGPCSFLINVTPAGDNFKMKSCGYHKIAAMLALGYDYLPDVEISYE